MGVATVPPVGGYACLIISRHKLSHMHKCNISKYAKKGYNMAKNKITVDIKAKGSESKMTFDSTRQLFGWLVRNPKAKVGADAKGNWFISVK